MNTEPTIQQQAEKFIHEQIGLSVDAPDNTPMDKKDCVYCLVKLTEFYDEVVCQKESIIETTHNNFLAALEEVKRLKGIIKKQITGSCGCTYCKNNWEDFCKENNMEP